MTPDTNNPSASHENMIWNAMQWFTLGLAYFAAGAILMTKMQEWVPLALNADAAFIRYAGWAMIVVFPLASLAIAGAGLQPLMTAYVKLLPTRWGEAATYFTPLVVFLMLVGVIAETMNGLPAEMSEPRAKADWSEEGW